VPGLVHAAVILARLRSEFGTHDVHDATHPRPGLGDSSRAQLVVRGVLGGWAGAGAATYKAVDHGRVDGLCNYR